MSGFIQWAITLISTYAAWHMRKRNLGLALATLCVGGLVSMSLGDFTVEGRQIGGFIEFLKVSVTGGLPTAVTTLIAWVLMLGFLVGVVLTLVIYRREAKDADTKRVAVVELRGLIDTSDAPLVSAIPARFIGRREDCRVELRSMVSPSELNVPAALVKQRAKVSRFPG